MALGWMRFKREAEGFDAIAAVKARGAPRLRAMPEVLGAAVMLNLLGLALPLVLLQIYDRIIPNQAASTLTLLVLGLMTVGVIELGLRLTQSVLVGLAATKFRLRLQIEAIERLVSAPREKRPNLSDSAIIESFKAIDRIADYYSGQSRLAMIDLPFSIVFIGVIAMIGGWLAVAPVVVFCFFFSALFWLGQRAKKLTGERDQHDARTSDFLVELLTGARTIKAHAIELMMLRRYERLLRTSAHINREMVGISAQTQALSVAFGNASMVTTLGVGAVLAVMSDLTIGSLAACSLLSGRAIQPLLRATNALTEREKLSVAIDEAGPLLALPPSTRMENESLAEIAPELQMRGVVLPRKVHEPLNDLSLTVKSGEIVAFLGGDGAGKTAFLRYAGGLTQPKEGEVLLEGAPAHIFRAARAGSVAFVSQDAQPLAGTILQNLTFFGRGASVEQARWVVETLGLDQLIDKLPQGYDTQIGVGLGDDVPQYMAHRLMIARAIAMRPRLLLIDEPGGRIDKAEEIFLFRALAKLRGGMTILVTTRRGAMLSFADRAFTFEEDGVFERAPSSFQAQAGSAA